MVLGQPISLVPQFLYVLRCLHAPTDRRARRFSGPERDEIQNRKSYETHNRWMISGAKGRF